MLSLRDRGKKKIMQGEREGEREWTREAKGDAKLLNRWPRSSRRGDDDGERPIRPLLPRFCYSPVPWDAAIQRACMAAMRFRDERRGREKRKKGTLLRRRRREKESKFKSFFFFMASELVEALHFYRLLESCLFSFSSLGHFRENQTHFFCSLSLPVQRDPLCQAYAPEQKRKERMGPLLGGGRPLVAPQPSTMMMPSTSSPAVPRAAFAPAPRHPCPAAPRAAGGMSYKDAGVDIDAGNELVRRIQKLNPSIGGFSGMVPFGESRLIARVD